MLIRSLLAFLFLCAVSGARAADLSPGPAPTQPQIEVFKALDARLEEQLKRWTQIKTDEVPKIAALIKPAELPAISISEKAAIPQ